MIFFSVEKLAALCKVDRETIRRWRNRGVNGVKLEARQSASLRGAALIFDEASVRTFMEANPKYVTKELDEALNPSSEPTSADYYAFSGQVARSSGDGYVVQMLEQQRNDLLKKINDIDKTLLLIKGEKK